ncbi:tetratricopeptide repeat protein [Roseovarius sp. 2305UL8-3]|uniref:tetratricopeptide repeat protein n=1 Tax=Roseovarius conchicola TaxID=3121636 RepID=UPI0035283294
MKLLYCLPLLLLPIATLAIEVHPCFELSPNDQPEISVPACTNAILSDTFEGAKLGEAYSNRGVANRELGNLEESASDLETSIKIDSSTNTLRMLAWTYREMSRYAEAETIYTNTLDADDHWQGWLSRCVVRQDLEKYQLALKDCKEALIRDPDNPDAAFLTARAFNFLGQGNLALPLANKATELEPERSYYWSELAWAAHLSGNTADAITLAEDALERFPGEADLTDFLNAVR